LKREPSKRNYDMNKIESVLDGGNGNCRYDKEFLLATLRGEYLRTKEWLVDLEALGIALRGGLISPAQAAQHMHDLDIMSPIGLQMEENAA
jgi:hypothetical protein